MSDDIAASIAITAVVAGLGGMLIGAWLRSMIDADRIAELLWWVDQLESGHHVQIDRIHEEAHHKAFRAFTDTKPSDKAPLPPE